MHRLNHFFVKEGLVFETLVGLFHDFGDDLVHYLVEGLGLREYFADIVEPIDLDLERRIYYLIHKCFVVLEKYLELVYINICFLFTHPN